METIKVNMNPNPLDVQTIHASQNDGEARQWEFELHNNGELIDTSDVKEQLVFKAYKGGTEQLLPENGSTPTTSPFKGDIKYPQGLLSDQEFLYRESPTEEDGLAKITDIKGNTLVWNQLIRNGNFADTSNWSAETGVNLSISNNIATISSTTASNGIRQYLSNSLTVNHKYLVKAEFNVPTEYRCVIGTGATQGLQIEKLISTVNTWTEVSGIGTCTASTTAFYCFVRGTAYENVKIRNVMCIDLTQMGLDITDPSDFTSLFSLSYYAYNQGSLLSFNGNGIKTVGKNQVANIVRGYFSVGVGVINVDNDSESVVFYAIKGKTYVSSSAVTLNRNAIARCDSPNLVHGSPIYDVVNTSRTWTATWTGWTVWYVYSSRNEAVENTAQVEFGTTATSYEPYTESVINLPISTYFPSGMKDVPDYTNGGKIYDEMTSNKADTRVGSVDLGTLNWTTYSSPERHVFRAHILSNMKQPNDANLPNAMCSRYEPMAYNPISANDDGYFAIGAQRIVIIEHDYTDPVAFKESLSNVYLYYELATPLENYGVVDLGSLTWSYNSSRTYFYSDGLQSVLKPIATNVVPNILCDKFVPDSADSIYAQRANKTIGYNATQELWVRDANYTDATAFKQAMSGVYLLYEKQNPQGFATASLVTENAEIPLSNEDGVLIGKCTEQLSSESGFFDAKIKLSDADGDCYSNKIQLHIERSPQ